MTTEQKKNYLSFIKGKNGCRNMKVGGGSDLSSAIKKDSYFFVRLSLTPGHLICKVERKLSKHEITLSD